MSAFKSKKKNFNTCQQSNEILDSFLGRMENERTTVELFNMDIADFDKLLALKRGKNTNVTREEVVQKYLAIALVLNASQKYEGLWTQL